jgi:hypothetical protein
MNNMDASLPHHGATRASFRQSFGILRVRVNSIIRKGSKTSKEHCTMEIIRPPSTPTSFPPEDDAASKINRRPAVSSLHSAISSEASDKSSSDQRTDDPLQHPHESPNAPSPLPSPTPSLYDREAATARLNERWKNTAQSVRRART